MIPILTFIHRTSDSIRSYRQSLQMLSQYNLWHYVVIAGIIALILGVFFLSVGGVLFKYTSHWISNIYPYQMLKSVVMYISATLSALLAILIGFFVYKGLLFAVLSPLLSHLSLNLEWKITGTQPIEKFNFVRSIMRGIGISIYLLLKELLLLLILIPLGWIPVIGIVITGLIFLVSAYYYGYGMLDYMMERHLDLRQSTSFVSRHKHIALGVGIGFMVILFIPIFGVVFAPILSTITATHLGLNALSLEELNQNEAPKIQA